MIKYAIMDKPYKILIVDDEENIRWVFKKALEKRDFQVDTVPSGEQALDKIQNNDYLVVFTDIFMEGLTGLELLERVKETKQDLRVVVMTAQDTMNNTIEAMRKGATDYISKPFDFDEIYALVDKAVISESIQAPPATLPEKETADFTVDAIIGKSKKMQPVFKAIGQLAETDLPVLITGESGTGKEMVARALHYYSKRNKRPFICINCAAISRELLESELFGHEKGAFTGAGELKHGKFELANNGTLFLDEIGDMELSLQAKILRALQDHEFYRVGGKEPVRVDVRILAATNQDLEALMERKGFREDLYHRLNVTHIHMPPLRERLEDVPLLANHFLTKFSSSLARGKVYLSPETERLIAGYSWRGNIRELENVIKRAVVLALSGPILPDHLPDHLANEQKETASANDLWGEKLNQLILDYLSENQWKEKDNLHDRLVQSMEKHLFEILLDHYSGKQVPTAKALGINRNTLKRKIDALKIQVKKKNDPQAI
ncbi:MAG: acetoacetate metabolism regulatory protein AtoC [Nitrospinaceae bacterium]|nr:MAG: acetoacetate metabolism regulatory protein AtoC [Nitrospinaceae bacterium]